MDYERARTPDIVIVGGGIAGSVAALLLARQGRSVTVIDPFTVYPPDFRCEKLTTDQLARVRRLQLYDLIAPHATPVRDVVIARAGGAIDARSTDELCFRYDALVNAVRSAWPQSVTLIKGRADDIESSPTEAAITLTGGGRITARLVVLATGPGEKLRAKLALQRRIQRKNHSLCIGFDLESGHGGALSPRSLIYYGEHAGDSVAFITAFPTDQTTRCNLFGYMDPAAPAVKLLRKDPRAGLRALMPGVLAILGADARLVGRSEIRITDLYDIPDPARDSVVLIGEAFKPSCPVSGTGVTRVLSDCEQLCQTHIPRWLATPGMAHDKIAQFYADPLKQAVDDASVANAERQRRFAVETSVKVRALRLAALIKSRARFLVSRQPGSTLSLRASQPYSAAAGIEARGLAPAPVSSLPAASPRITV